MNKELTKEECLAAIDIIARYCSEARMGHNPPRFKLTNELDVLMQLINEHFELKEKYKTLVLRYDSLLEEYGKLRWNPPLKFEELHEGMWVWDNLLEMYVKIASCDTDVIVVDQHYRYFKSAFDENRFYRYEVKENDDAD